MIHVDGSRLIAWLKEAGELLRDRTKRALELTTEAAVIYARTSTLYNKRTGALHRSIRPQVGARTAQVSAKAAYAYYVENGTRPHPIVARRAKVLRFEMSGEIVFRKRVYHPGTQPRPFMKEAARQTTPLFSRLIAEAATFR